MVSPFPTCPRRGLQRLQRKRVDRVLGGSSVRQPLRQRDDPVVVLHIDAPRRGGNHGYSRNLGRHPTVAGECLDDNGACVTSSVHHFSCRSASDRRSSSGLISNAVRRAHGRSTKFSSFVPRGVHATWTFWSFQRPFEPSEVWRK